MVKTSLFHCKASSGSPRLANLRSILATATNGGDVVRGGAAFMETGQGGGMLTTKQAYGGFHRFPKSWGYPQIIQNRTIFSIETYDVGDPPL